MQKNNTYKYYAFISYSSKDTKWGKRLHRKLESFRIPTTICNEKGWKRKPISPVFLAPYEIQPGDLTEELKKRLRQSRNLIVVCSPHSAQSEWVAKEIAYFHSLGRVKNIYFFIIDGVPHSKSKETECINPIIDELEIPEILGANINEGFYRCQWLNRERAYVQLITKLLGIEYDAIWQRHKRMLIQRIILRTILLILFVLSLVWMRKHSLPVDINVSLKETSIYNKKLPPLENVHISLYLPDLPPYNIVINDEYDIGVFKDIAHRYIDKEVRVKVNCLHYNDVDTTFVLSKNIQINMSRDESFYGMICFDLWDSETKTPLKKFSFMIDDFHVTTDEMGKVSFFIPLEKQKTVYYLSGSDFVTEDSIVMPCRKEDEYVILGKHISVNNKK